MKRFLLIALLITLPVLAQDRNENTPSLFDDSEIKEYAVKPIIVDGEVENPGIVDLSILPLNGFPVKDVTFSPEKNKFIGSYFITGYSLFDIINAKKIKKANEAEFKPAVDLYVIVENDKGEKAVFSWGELFYSKDNFRAVIAKTVRAINPSKMVMKWPIPETSRIFCGNDAFNFRNISSPVKITVKSYAGSYSKDRVKETFAPEILVVKGAGKSVIKDVAGFETRKIRNLGYGHGMGWKGVTDYEGFVFRTVLEKNVKFSSDEIRSTILCFSAKDGYRATFSLSEIINRADTDDFLLVEKNGTPDNGKYNLFATPDFFVDRNIRSLEKIEILNIN